MRRTLRIAALVFAFGLAAACGDDSTTTISLSDGGFAPAADDIQTEPVDGSIAGLTFSTLEGGADGFAEHLDKPLVVNFFAATCAPCRAEMPDLEAVFRELGDQVNFLGISRDEVAQHSLDLVEETGVTYPTGWDKDGSLFVELGLFAMPSTLLVDTDGVIVDQWGGALTGDALRKMIDESLL